MNKHLHWRFRWPQRLRGTSRCRRTRRTWGSPSSSWPAQPTPSAHASSGNPRHSLTHPTESPIYAFPEMKLRGLIPNSYIHVSVSDLYISTLDSRQLRHLSPQPHTSYQKSDFFLVNSLYSHAHPWSCVVLNCSCYLLQVGLSVSLLSSNCLCRCPLQFFISLFLCPFPLVFSVSMSYTWHTALYRKSDLCIPKNETAWPHSQFLHSCIRERFIYFHPRLTPPQATSRHSLTHPTESPIFFL